MPEHDYTTRRFCRRCHRYEFNLRGEVALLPECRGDEFLWTSDDSHHWMQDVVLGEEGERHDIYVTKDGRLLDGCDAACNGLEILVMFEPFGVMEKEERRRRWAQQKFVVLPQAVGRLSSSQPNLKPRKSRSKK